MGSPSSSLRKSPSSSREEQSPGLVDGGPSETTRLHEEVDIQRHLLWEDDDSTGMCSSIFPWTQEKDNPTSYGQ